MEYALALALVTASGVFFLALVESAHGSISEVTLRSLAAEMPDKAPQRVFLRHLLSHRLEFWLSLSLGLQTGTLVITAVAVWLAQRFSSPLAMPLALGAALFLVVPARQILPRILVQNQPEAYLLRLLPWFRLYFNAVQPIVRPMRRFISRFRVEPERSLIPDSLPPTEGESIQALIDVGEEAGIIEEEEGELIQSVIEFSDTAVREIMTPRPDIVSVRASATVREASETMTRERHSRLPVFEQDSDDIVGIVFIRDVLDCLLNGREHTPVREIVRPAYFVPENKGIADLLEDMRKSAMQIALVIDEYGDVAGLVTVEDILEEIVGEIEDEDQSGEDEDVLPETDGAWLVRGSTEIRKVELVTEQELSGDDFQTVNGFIVSELERVPATGEHFVVRGLEVEVLESDGRAIRRVRLRKAAPSSQTAEKT
ncbi:MAG: hemolysin family protein [Chloracidobacterium sp.]|nr:hemolysin family protein [Chloracidobacterium sp.]MDW8216767.1 hemolysin family protein [Acidobacteriota bacterium]